MSRQEFHTADALALEVQTAPTSFLHNAFPWAVDTNAITSLAGWEPVEYTAALTCDGSVMGVAPDWMLAGHLTFRSGRVAANPDRPRVRYLHHVALAGRAHRIRFVYFGPTGEGFGASPWTTHTGTGEKTHVATLPEYVDHYAVEVELSHSSGTFPATSSPGSAVWAMTSAALITGPTAQSSVIAAVTLADVVQRPWTNVLPDATRIEVKRSALDVDTLTVDLRDPDLIPTGATSLLLSGHAVRLVRLGDGERLFTGRIATDGVKVTTDTTELLRDPTSHDAHLVRVTAHGEAATLAMRTRENGPGRLSDASAILAGRGVPFTVSGAMRTFVDLPTNGAPGNTLDLLEVARDTDRGLVWIDRRGWLHAYQPHQVPGLDGAFGPGDIPRRRSGRGWTGVSQFSQTLYNPAGYLTVVGTGTSGLCEMTSPTGDLAHPVTAGETLTVTARLTAPGVARTPRLGVSWFDATGAHISTVGTDLAALTANTIATRSINVTAPSNAAYVAVLVGFYVVNDPNGTFLNVHSVRLTSAITAPTRHKGTIGSTAITDLALGTSSGVNLVTVEVRGSGGTTGTYGPWSDTRSTLTGGRVPAKYTVAPVTSQPAQWSEAYGREVLDRCRPLTARQPLSVTFPIATTAALGTWADVDVYDTVTISDTPLGVLDTVRVTSVAHSIVPDADLGGVWTVTLGLTEPSTMPLPTKPA